MRWNRGTPLKARCGGPRDERASRQENPSDRLPDLKPCRATDTLAIEPARSAAPALPSRALIEAHGEGGQIVSTASIAGLVAGSNPAYNMTKYGVVALSEGLRVTLCPLCAQALSARKS
jgi:NAD(P)-dependent dehydrogenase (short-subunit alcohol dehydrogenase family)